MARLALARETTSKHNNNMHSTTILTTLLFATTTGALGSKLGGGLTASIRGSLANTVSQCPQTGSWETAAYAIDMNTCFNNCDMACYRKFQQHCSYSCEEVSVDGVSLPVACKCGPA